ncbi:MAG: hypothetical protein Q9212_005513 [Teloschistes hypoglaucus]
MTRMLLHGIHAPIDDTIRCLLQPRQPWLPSRPTGTPALPLAEAWYLHKPTARPVVAELEESMKSMGHEDDDAHLATLGHKAELQRNFSPL